MSPTTSPRGAAFRWGAATDKGKIREGNEDFMSAASGFFVVADGMGGHRGGETASHIAVETLKAGFPSASPADREGEAGESGTAALVHAVELANQEILRTASTDAELEGMGTTLCALAKVSTDAGEQLAVVNVGDSRAYVLRGGDLRQLTEDHSLVATLERQGRITSDEAAVHPQRNILTRALGIDDEVMVDSWELGPVAGDRFLLCTDGLFNEVDDARIAATLRRLADPDEAARELVRLANERGGRDNITVLVVDVLEEELDQAGQSAGPGQAGGAADATTRGPLPEQPDEPAQATQPAQAKPRRFTWRVVLFLVVLLAILGTAGGIIYYGVNNSEPPPPTTTTTTTSSTSTSTTSTTVPGTQPPPALPEPPPPSL